MALVALPKRRSVKPPLGTGVEWGHPLASGLACLTLVNSPTLQFNQVSGYPYNNGIPNVPVIVGQQGLELSFTGGNSISFTNGAPQSSFLPLNGEISIAHWQKVNTVTASSAFGILDASPNSCQAHVPYSDNTIYWDYGDNAVNRVSVAHPTPITGVYYFFVFTSSVKAGSVRIYCNGNLLASGVSPATSIAPPADAYGIGQGVAGAPTSSVVYNAVWNRALTASEVWSLYVDPYAFMQPQSPLPRYWMPPAPIPPDTTIDMPPVVVYYPDVMMYT